MTLRTGTTSPSNQFPSSTTHRRENQNISGDVFIFRLANDHVSQPPCGQKQTPTDDIKRRLLTEQFVLQKRPEVPFVAVVFQPLIFLSNGKLSSLWVSVKHLKTSLWAFFFFLDRMIMIDSNCSLCFQSPSIFGGYFLGGFEDTETRSFDTMFSWW